MGKSRKKEKSERINLVKQQYESFLEEDRKRRERNEYILQRLDSMRSPTTASLQSNIEIGKHQKAPETVTSIPEVEQLVTQLLTSKLRTSMSPNDIFTFLPQVYQNQMLIPKQVPPNNENNIEQTIIRELSKKYILIPKLRGPFPETLRNVNAEQIYQPPPKIVTAEKDWKSKYDILAKLNSINNDDVKREENESSQQFENKENNSSGITKTKDIFYDEKITKQKSDYDKEPSLNNELHNIEKFKDITKPNDKLTGNVIPSVTNRPEYNNAQPIISSNVEKNILSSENGSTHIQNTVHDMTSDDYNAETSTHKQVNIESQHEPNIEDNQGPIEYEGNPAHSDYPSEQHSQSYQETNNQAYAQENIQQYDPQNTESYDTTQACQQVNGQSFEVTSHDANNSYNQKILKQKASDLTKTQTIDANITHQERYNETGPADGTEQTHDSNQLYHQTALAEGAEPAYDPSQPYNQTALVEGAKQPYDPSQAYDQTSLGEGAEQVCDPNQPYDQTAFIEGTEQIYDSSQPYDQSKLAEGADQLYDQSQVYGQTAVVEGAEQVYDPNQPYDQIALAEGSEVPYDPDKVYDQSALTEGAEQPYDQSQVYEQTALVEGTKHLYDSSQEYDQTALATGVEHPYDSSQAYNQTALVEETEQPYDPNQVYEQTTLVEGADQAYAQSQMYEQTALVEGADQAYDQSQVYEQTALVEGADQAYDQSQVYEQTALVEGANQVYDPISSVDGVEQVYDPSQAYDQKAMAEGAEQEYNPSQVYEPNQTYDQQYNVDPNQAQYADNNGQYQYDQTYNETGYEGYTQQSPQEIEIPQLSEGQEQLKQ